MSVDALEKKLGYDFFPNLEQAEEEDNASKLVDKFTLFGTNGSGLHSLDSDLGARVYTAPSLVVG